MSSFVSSLLQGNLVQLRKRGGMAHPSFSPGCTRQLQSHDSLSMNVSRQFGLLQCYAAMRSFSHVTAALPSGYLALHIVPLQVASLEQHRLQPEQLWPHCRQLRKSWRS